MRVVEHTAESFAKAKDVAADALRRQTPKKRFREEDSVLEGWLYRETSVQGTSRRLRLRLPWASASTRQA